MSTDKTLADVQPGGRVRLGDQAHVTMSEDDFANMVETVAGEHGEMLEDGGPYNGWCFSCEELIDFSRSIITGWDWERRAQEYALSAQPSPGGQDEDMRALAASIGEVAHRLSTYMPHLSEWADRARDCKKAAEVLSALAARQPVGVSVDFYVCDACGHYYMENGVTCDCSPEAVQPPLRHIRMVATPTAQAVDLDK